MPLEKEGCSEIMTTILEKFPNRATISAAEAAKIMGVNIKTVYSAINRTRDPLPHKKLTAKKVVIPIGKFARWLS